MSIKNYCPNCGNELENSGDNFCSECGYQLNQMEKTVKPDIPKSNGFFNNLTMKTSFPILIYSFIVTAIFIFIGSLLWGVFLSKQTITVYTYFILTFIFASFFGGMFLGLVACKDETYILPNFLVYIGTIVAILMGGGSLVFTSFWSAVSVASGLFGSNSNNYASSSSDVNDYANSYYDGISSNANDYSSSTGNTDSSIISNLGFNIIILIIGIPVANYLGILAGYYLKKNI